MGGAFPAAAMAFVATAALLAGCAGDKAPGRPPSALDDVDVQPAVAGKGAVAGLVVDESIHPVVGARISIAEAEVATTDEEGVFILDALEPGLVIFSVAATGFLPVQTSAEVQAGATVEVRVQMPRDTNPVPYAVTYSHDGYMQAWAGIVQYSVENQAQTPLCDCRIYFMPEAGATTIVFEAYWEYSLPDPAGLGEFYYVVDQPEGEGNREDWCYSPCVAHIGFASNDFQPGIETYARLDGPDNAPAAEQRFEMFVTVWYNGEAPDGWTVAG